MRHIKNLATTINLYLKEQLDNNDKHLVYFTKNNISIDNISYLGKGEYSKTYKVSTNKGDYAINIRDEMVGDYSALIGEYYNHLPEVYDVSMVDGKYCVVMEVLLPISDNEKNIIDCIDYLFYTNDEDGLDVWLEDNLHNDLYLKIEELVSETNINKISEKQYTSKLQWFYNEYNNYESFIDDILSSFKEYNQVLGFNYVDFHGDNLMRDKYGDVKLIDL
jgi:hypothetical protein